MLLRVQQLLLHRSGHEPPILLVDFWSPSLVVEFPTHWPLDSLNRILKDGAIRLLGITNIVKLCVIINFLHLNDFGHLRVLLSLVPKPQTVRFCPLDLEVGLLYQMRTVGVLVLHGIFDLLQRHLIR